MTTESEPPEEVETPIVEPEPVPIAPVGRPWVGRDDIGEDSLTRWERDDLKRYANTGDARFLHSILDEGSPVARARAARLMEARPHSDATPALPPPRPDFRERAAQLAQDLRRRRAVERSR